MASPLTRCACALAAVALVGSPAAAQSVYTYTQSDNTGNNISLGYPPPIPVASQTQVAGFREYSSVFARYQDLMLTLDEVTGQQVGTSIAGRAIWAYSVTGTNATTIPQGLAKPAAMLLSGVHAREWQPPEAVASVVERLLDNRTDAGFHEYLLENMNLVVIPHLNPDGVLQTHRFPNQTTGTSKTGTPTDGRLRRKNMRSVDEVLTTFTDRALGVDVNRNQPFGFGNAGSSGTTTNETYRGTSAQSEPESQALVAAAALGPAARLRMHIDNHSYTKVFITPQTGNARRDSITATLATRMINAIGTVNGSAYSYDPSPVGNEVGATDEYMAFTYQIPSYTLETEPASSSAEYGGIGRPADGFILPDSQIARVRTDLQRGMLLGLYHQAGPPAIQSIRITDTGTSAAVVTGAWGAPAPTNRAFTKSLDASLVRGRSYSLWVSFSKPMRWRDTGNNVINYPGQSVTLAPTATITGTGDGGAAISIPVTITTTSWLRTAGGAPTGFANYADDALLGTFTIPSGAPISSPVTLRLEVTATDMSGLALDANPATPVDWASGAWSGYENTSGVAGDTGGTDRTITFTAIPPSAIEGWDSYGTR